MSDFVPQLGRLIAWTWEKVQKLLFCKFSNSYFSKAISLTSSDNVFVDVFLSIIGFLHKSLSCMFHECFMRSTDRKYCSESALVVVCLVHWVVESFESYPSCFYTLWLKSGDVFQIDSCLVFVTRLVNRLRVIFINVFIDFQAVFGRTYLVPHCQHFLS